MPKHDKILSIQYLRGLAALGVVLCHYGSNLVQYPGLSRFFNFGQNGVHVFFLISGFIIVYSLDQAGYKPKQFFTFLVKRSIRIDPAYFVVILLTLVLFKMLSFVPSFRGERAAFIPLQFIAHILYFIPFTKYPFYNHVFWTLSVEFQFYVLIGVFYFLAENYLYKLIFLVIFSLTCFIPFDNAYYLVLTYAPIFALGISLFVFYSDRKWMNLILPIILLGLIEYRFGLGVAYLLLFSSLMLFLLNALIKPLIFLGNISYSLYLTHGLCLIVFLGLAKKININLGQNQLWWLFVEVLIAMLIAFLFYLLIERPSMILSKHIFYKKRQRIVMDLSKHSR
jgi:peptidoglycan/LPS O-acetylase OafA/YrhL